MPIARAPIVGRTGHSAVWTGDELIVWSGRPQLPQGDRPLRYRPDGASYDPVADRWRTLARAPIAGRAGHSAVWTGSEMIVWGGRDVQGQPLTDGAAYDPATDSWRAIAAPDRVQVPVDDATWTGEAMIAWGLDAESAPIASAYDPVADAWRTLPPPGLPAGEAQSSAWTGSELVTIVYLGGADLATAVAAYDPAAETWRSGPTPLSSLYQPDALWTGQEVLMLGLGGPAPRTGEASGGYDPAGDCWRIPSRPDFAVRATPVWSGELVVDVGGTYDPRTDLWVEAPAPPKGMRRESYSATWAGDRAIYWAGRDLGGGARPEVRSGFAFIPGAAAAADALERSDSSS